MVNTNYIFPQFFSLFFSVSGGRGDYVKKNKTVVLKSVRICKELEIQYDSGVTSIYIQETYIGAKSHMLAFLQSRKHVFS